MKKITKALLIAVFMLVFLTGCYKQDTVINIGHGGSICAEVSFIGNDEAIMQVSGGGTFEDLENGILPQINSMIVDASKEKCEKISEEVNGEKRNGFKFTGYYSSLKEMENSQIFYAYNNSVAVPVATGEYMEGANGVYISSEDSFWGTTYKAKGKISLTQGQEASAEEVEKLKTASANITLKFPFGAFSTSGGNSNIVMPSFSYTATTENDNIPVDVSVFVPNYIPILMILLIIVLIVIVIIQSLKIKKLKKIIEGESEKVTEETFDKETFISKDDEEFFEGSDDTVEFDNPLQQPRKKDESEVIEEVEEVEENEETTSEENTEE